ncbi:hypothetical protein Tco_1216922 [Tanacetum coccineum]
MSSDKESSAAGTDNCPPMLVESDYESWKIRIERYIRGKPLGKLIWISIQNGPTPHPQITVTEGQGDVAVQVPRDKQDEDQGLPRHVFNILNQTRTGKEIWDNVELLMKGSGKSLQQQKEELFDEYERFRAIGNESIHDYFVRFHKLINDMKITQLDILTISDETKFVNKPSSYWARHRQIKESCYGADGQIITETVQREELLVNVVNYGIEEYRNGQMDTTMIAVMEEQQLSMANFSSTVELMVQPPNPMLKSDIDEQYDSVSSVPTWTSKFQYDPTKEDLDLLHEDLEHIDDMGIEEMDIKLAQIAIIAIRMKKFYKKTGRRVRIDGNNLIGS